MRQSHIINNNNDNDNDKNYDNDNDNDNDNNNDNNNNIINMFNACCLDYMHHRMKVIFVSKVKRQLNEKCEFFQSLC